MRTQAAPTDSIAQRQLLLVLELAAANWRLVFCDPITGNRRRVVVKSWGRVDFERQLVKAKARLMLSEAVEVICCQEAGRDGFSIHRYLESLGLHSQIIDPASVSVCRRRRRVKTDRLDAEQLMDHLLRQVRGESGVWRVVVVPSVEAEQRRHLGRQLDVLKCDRTRILNRMRSLLITVGIRISSRRHLRDLDALRCWDGSPLPVLLRTRLDLEVQRLTLIEQQMRLLDQQRQELTAQESFDMGLVRQLLQLRCLGWETAWCLVTECFGYRRFQNRRQVGACAGLTPTPYDSGESRREQGIGKDGNRRLRAILIEMSWMWLRLQPDSALTKWFHARFGANGRSRRVGIVAMARKLLVALWRYLDQGIVPAGAVLKPA